MECPVCYEDCHKTCNLVCRHIMCMSCVKQWWIRSEGKPTCPVCRQNLYFRGMRKMVDRWADEIEEPPEYEEEDWDSMCNWLLEVRNQFHLPWIKLVEPTVDTIVYTCPLVYIEFPSTWFHIPHTHLNRPKPPRGYRGRRANWLEE